MPDGSVHTGLRTVDVDEATQLPKEPGAMNGTMVKRDRVIGHARRYPERGVH